MEYPKARDRRHATELISKGNHIVALPRVTLGHLFCRPIMVFSDGWTHPSDPNMWIDRTLFELNRKFIYNSKINGPRDGLIPDMRSRDIEVTPLIVSPYIKHVLQFEHCIRVCDNFKYLLENKRINIVCDDILKIVKDYYLFDINTEVCNCKECKDIGENEDMGEYWADF